MEFELHGIRQGIAVKPTDGHRDISVKLGIPCVGVEFYTDDCDSGGVIADGTDFTTFTTFNRYTTVKCRMLPSESEASSSLNVSIPHEIIAMDVDPITVEM